MMRSGGALIFLLLALSSSLTPWLGGWQAHLTDAQFRFLRLHGLRPAAPDVVIVGFDETTIAALPEPLALWHVHLGRFLQAMASAQPAAIGLDVVLPDRSFDAVMPGNDRALIGGIVLARRAAPLVLALTLDPSGATRTIHAPLRAAAGTGAWGHAVLPSDPDGVVRRFHENLAQDGSTVDTFAGQLARRLGMPVNAGLIDFAYGQAFGFIPLQQVLTWHDAGDSDALRQAFAGKVVLLGSVLKYEDRHPSPVALAAWDSDNHLAPGVVRHAQILRNLLAGGLVQPAAAWVAPLLALLAAGAWFWKVRGRFALLAFAVLATACLVLSTWALGQGIAAPVVPALVTAACAMGARQLVETLHHLRERMQMRRVFAGYVSPDVMQEILADKIVPALGGEQRFASVLFSDIRGYATRSETMTPQQTIAFLNRYFDRIVPLIHAHGGTVIGFMGDGIMAVFGAPKPMQEPCAAAVAAAQRMLDEVGRMNAEFAGAGEAPVQIGIGLHAGIGVAGHIGASSRHEYSVIGDVTNVASRLEGVTKEVGYHLVVSRAVIDRLPDAGGFVALGLHAIKGHSAVEIFGYQSVGGSAST